MSDLTDKMIQNMERLKGLRAANGGKKKSQKNKEWQKAFDELYGERVKMDGSRAIEEIIFEQTGIKVTARQIEVEKKLDEIDERIKQIEKDGGDSEFEVSMYEELAKIGGKVQ